MKAIRLLNMILLVLAASTTVSAAPVLLATHDMRAEPAVAPQAETRVEFTLELIAQDSYPPGPRLGTGVFWGEGAAGTVDFTADTNRDFLRMGALATNGVNDQYFIHVTWPNGTGGAGGGAESRLFNHHPYIGEPPDLVGYELELVRLTVHDVHFEPWPEGGDGDGYLVQANLTYEFFGSPVPEPPTLLLLVGGITFLLRHFQI